MFPYISPSSPAFLLFFTSAGLLGVLRWMEDVIHPMKRDMVFFAVSPDYYHWISIIEFWLVRVQSW
jgi:hypothetical protein